MCLAGEGERGGGEGTIRKIGFYAFLHLAFASVLYSYILNRVLFVNLNYLDVSFPLECCQDLVWFCPSTDLHFFLIICLILLWQPGTNVEGNPYKDKDPTALSMELVKCFALDKFINISGQIFWAKPNIRYPSHACHDRAGLFLSDPGVPGVRSMGPVVSHWVSEPL